MKAAKILWVIAIIFLSQGVSVGGALDPKDLRELKLLTFHPPDKAPEFTLKNLAGEDVSLARFRGKPLLVYFWATW